MDINFEFLRPWWLLALVPVVLILLKAWQIKTHQGSWQKVIAPKFQKLLLGRGAQPQSKMNVRLAILGLGLIWLLTIIALAGPSLKSVKLPAEKTQQGSVIILDLSLSMLADDVMPNRISRARFKLIDLLKKHPEQSIGLIGYAGTAHSIAPISEDNTTLLELLPVLNPMIMPEYGSNPLQAMQLAEKMFQASQINQGHFIWVTDDIEPTQRKAIQAWLNKRNISLSILAVGTQAGGTVKIPNYGLLRDQDEQIITPKLPYKELQTLSNATGAALTPLKVDDSDLALLIPSNLAAIAEQKKQTSENKEVLHKLDDGSALILLLLPMLAFAYRRGWLFSVTLLMFLPLGALYSPTSYAENTQATETKLPAFTEVFETGDQQGYKAFQNNDLQAAEALFESPQWRASTLYRLEKYPEAAAQFKKDKSAKGHYNLGNALAKQGKLEEAKQAYEQALTQQPDFADAQSNLALVEQILEQQKQNNERASGDSKDDGSAESESKENQKTEPQKSDDDQPAKDNEPASGSSGDSQDNDQPSNDSTPEKNEADSQQTTDSADNGEAKQEQKDEKDQAASAKLEGESGKDGQQADPENTDSKGKPGDVPPSPDQPSAEQTPSGLAGEEPENKADNKPENEEPANDSKPEPFAPRENLDDQQDPTKQDLTEIKQQEQQRATDNWLKQIPDQPGLFLKRKFEYQYQQQNGTQKPSSKPAEKIW